MKKVKSTSLLLGLASAMAFAQDGAACVKFENGSGDFIGKCFNDGLLGMAEGKCYKLVDARANDVQGQLWINNIATESWWWEETACGGEEPVSSSSEVAESSSSEVAESSSSEEVVESSSSEEIVESSSSEEVVESSSSEVVNPIGKCIAFVNGDGNYDVNCYNVGLDEMAEGKCYTMNPDRVAESGVPQYISNRASDKWWWVETPCADEPESSSSAEESSSSVEESSSSEEVVESSSSEEVVESSSSEEVVESSSSEEVVESSSSEEVVESSSSEEVVESSSSEEVVESSSSEESSSSVEVVEPVERCIAYDRNMSATQIADNCYKSGMRNMVEGKCYELNPKHPSINKNTHITSDATNKTWWVETNCYEGGMLVEKCVALDSKTVNADNVADNCYNEGLTHANGKCFTINPAILAEFGSYEGFSTDASASKRKNSSGWGWGGSSIKWWVETPCTEEIVPVSSSSSVVVESSSSEEVVESSSSEEVVESSSSEEVVESSSSEEVVESSSSEEVVESSSSEEVVESSSSEEVVESSSSEEVVESSSSEEVVESSSSEVVEPVAKCIAFVNGDGNYDVNCYNVGLDEMAEGKCYTMNPARVAESGVPQYISNRASDTWWWVETECFDAPVSSSSEEVVESSSSEEVVESSSSEEVVESSSSEEVVESSSSEEVIESSSSEVVSKCIAFVNGDGDYDKNCYNTGLDEMAEGKCYTMNPVRVAENGVPQYISNRASDTWWWIETACADEPEVVEEPILVDCKGGDCIDVKPIAADPKMAPQFSNDSDNGTLSVVTAVEAKASMVVMNNTLNIATTSNGTKSLKVFNVRGDMLLSESFAGATKSLDMSKFAGKGAVIVRLVEGRKVLATKRIAVR
jgi:hypothetical protein